MFTTCTNCHTKFRLTAAQLTAAQGQVRCGQCHEVFDAYEVLEGADIPPRMRTAEPLKTADVPIQIEQDAHRSKQRKLRTPLLDVGARLSVEQDAEQKVEMPPSMTAEDEPITSAPNLKAGSRKSPPPPIDDLFAQLPDHPEPTAAKGPGRKPGTPLLDVGAGLTAEQEAEREVPEALYVAAVGVHAPHAQHESPAELPSAGHKHRSKWLDMPFLHVEHLSPPHVPKPHRPAVTAAWWLGIVILALLLTTQFIDMDRAALSQNAVIGPSLQAVYAALGHPLSEQVSVSDWNVGTLNVTTDPDSNGALSITGTLANQAGFVQPWPALRVVLTDRFGETLRSRDFKPADYLPAGQANAVLAPGLTARFRLDIVDPGADAVGFSLTPCLDVAAGRICAAPSMTD